jgi:hypothetical protein
MPSPLVSEDESACIRCRVETPPPCARCRVCLYQKTSPLVPDAESLVSHAESFLARLQSRKPLSAPSRHALPRGQPGDLCQMPSHHRPAAAARSQEGSAGVPARRPNPARVPTKWVDRPSQAVRPTSPCPSHPTVPFTGPEPRRDLCQMPSPDAPPATRPAPTPCRSSSDQPIARRLVSDAESPSPPPSRKPPRITRPACVRARVCPRAACIRTRVAAPPGAALTPA